jgi:hypothetical protein
MTGSIDPWPDHPAAQATPLGAWYRANTTPMDFDLAQPPADLIADTGGAAA